MISLLSRSRSDKTIVLVVFTCLRSRQETDIEIYRTLDKSKKTMGAIMTLAAPLAISFVGDLTGLDAAGVETGAATGTKHCAFSGSSAHGEHVSSPS